MLLQYSLVSLHEIVQKHLVVLLSSSQIADFIHSFNEMKLISVRESVHGLYTIWVLLSISMPKQFTLPQCKSLDGISMTTHPQTLPSVGKLLHETLMGIFCSFHFYF